MDLKGKYGEAKIFAELFDDATVSQVHGILDSPISQDSKIRIMPDCHAGAGCVVGTTMEVKDKVCPNIVGVDIGCGVLVVRLGSRPIDYPALDEFIKKNIPSGFAVNSESNGLADALISTLRCESRLTNRDRLTKSLGSLGGGNHFIEIDETLDGTKYLLIHSGSRNLGLQVAKIYQNMATSTINKINQAEVERIVEENKANGTPELIEVQMKEYKENFKRSWPEALDYLSGQCLEDYLHDMNQCQVFAAESRKNMAYKIVRHLQTPGLLVCDTVHNYIDVKDRIIRKGAVSAKEGEILVIPINMRDGSLLCRGKGNAEWNYSAPHGAGRIMSRHQAKAELSVEEFQNTMKGIYTSTANKDTLDEAPMAYKPIEAIMDVIQDTVEIGERMYPLYNFKAGGE